MSLTEIFVGWSVRGVLRLLLKEWLTVSKRGSAEMTRFQTRAMGSEPDLLAPDGMEVRLLAAVASGSMAHFRLAPGQCARAVSHRTVNELWHCVSGRGEIWRRQGEAEEIVALTPGVSLSIPLGTHFQVRAAPDTAIEAVAVTMPPWPGDDEAMIVEGIWTATVDEPSG